MSWRAERLRRIGIVFGLEPSFCSRRSPRLRTAERPLPHSPSRPLDGKTVTRDSLKGKVAIGPENMRNAAVCYSDRNLSTECVLACCLSHTPRRLLAIVIWGEPCA